MPLEKKQRGKEEESFEQMKFHFALIFPAMFNSGKDRFSLGSGQLADFPRGWMQFWQLGLCLKEMQILSVRKKLYGQLYCQWHA